MLLMNQSDSSMDLKEQEEEAVISWWVLHVSTADGSASVVVVDHEAETASASSPSGQTLPLELGNILFSC